MPEAGWAPIANAAARDHRLSWRARGLLLELLSYQDGWDITVDALVKKARAQGPASEGRGAMRVAVKELADTGYVRYVREQDKETGKWVTELYVSDDPQVNRRNDRRTGNRTVGEPERRLAETSETGTSGGRYITKKTDTNTVKKTDQQHHHEHDATLTSFASVAKEDLIKNDEDYLAAAYGHIDTLSARSMQDGLLKLERKRPAIYRQCRQRSLDQIERESGREAVTDAHATARVDRLSLKYAAQHYAPALPDWFLRAIKAR